MESGQARTDRLLEEPKRQETAGCADDLKESLGSRNIGPLPCFPELMKLWFFCLFFGRFLAHGARPSKRIAMS
jgi:hypothetical protein